MNGTRGAVRVQVNPQRFRDGVKSAKRLHGAYDAATKTWLIPAAMASFLGPQNPGLIRVGPPLAPARCPHYTTDQGCPLHGETCTGGVQ